ncbi:MAG: hypothetical protein AAF773_07350 [Cyanobacteria bacterium P01_D01_bin.115]
MSTVETRTLGAIALKTFQQYDDGKTPRLQNMTLIAGLGLIFVAWLMSVFVGGIPSFWHFWTIAPQWVTGIIIISLLAWFVSEPRA